MKMRGKQRAARWLSALFALCLMVLLLPEPAQAAEKYVDCYDTSVTITVDEWGDGYVTEERELFFGGDSITRYGRNYRLSESNPYTYGDFQIYLDGEPMTVLDAPDDSRPVGCAAVYDVDGGVKVDVYLDGEVDVSHDLEIDYIVYDMVALYDDKAEFHWNLASVNEPHDIWSMTGNIYLPTGCMEEDVELWSKGPDTREFYVDLWDDDLHSLYYTAGDTLYQGTTAAIRVAAPLELFPYAERTASGSVYDALVEDPDVDPSVDDPYVEPNRPSPTEEYHFSLFDRIKLTLMRFSEKLTVVFFFLIPGSVVFANVASRFVLRHRIRRSRKKHRYVPASAPDYYRSIPNDMSPAIVHRLMRVYGDENEEVCRDGSALSATIMDLMERGVLVSDFTRDDEGEQVLSFGVSENVFAESLTEYEKAVVALFQEVIERKQGRNVTKDEVTEFLKDDRSRARELREWFQTGVDDAFEALNCTETYGPKLSGGKRFLICEIVVVGLSTLGLWGEMGAFSLIFALAFGSVCAYMINSIIGSFFPTVAVLTQEGEDAYALWSAYVRYLDDFALFEEREVVELSMWRRHMVYAVALGRSDKVSQAMPAFLRESKDVYFSSYDDMYSDFDDIDDAGFIVPVSSGSSSGWGSDSSSDWGDSSSGWDSGDSGCDSDSGSGGGDFD